MKWRKLLGRGMSALFVIFLGVLFFFAIWRFEEVALGFRKVVNILMPIIYGFIIAFLVNPIVKKIENFIVPFLRKFFKNEERAKRMAKGVGIFTGLIFFVAIITALFLMVIPELYKSIYDLVVALPKQMNELFDYVNDILQGDSKLGAVLKGVLIEGGEALELWFLDWVQNDLLKQTNNIMTNLTAGVISVVGGVMDFLVGIIVSVYLLYGKETFLKQGKKIIYAFNPPKRANLILHIAEKTSKTFSGFIIGKIIDSAIIGVLCFIGLSILKMPYALLVSAIVGVTNVIPFFGPFIGAIPSAILIFLSDPMKGLYFVIFIIVLQQLDGNVIGPKILGESTGLSAFWVIFAILLGGGLFGFVGMLVSVPLFAVIYYGFQMYLQHKLEEKKLPTETEYYTKMNRVDDEGNFMMDKEEEEIEDADTSAE